MTTDTSDDEFDISNANHNKMTEKMEKVSRNNLFRSLSKFTKKN